MRTPLSYSTVLIVEGYSLSACALADRFRSTGAKVHVVNTAAAAGMLLRNKKIDVAFVGYMMKQANTTLGPLFDQYGVPYITCATPTSMAELADELRDATVT
jgi:CheY-like chemotaxis protein